MLWKLERCRTAQHGQANIEIAAPPQVVYDLIADVTRMGASGARSATDVSGSTGRAPLLQERGFVDTTGLAASDGRDPR